MKNTFKLKIIASDKLFYDGECEMIVFDGIDGNYGVLPNHESTVAALIAGELKFKVNGEWKYAAVGNGFVNIKPEAVILLSDTVELPEEIDIKRVLEAKQRAEERMKQSQNMREYYYTRAALARALARLKVTDKTYK